MPRTFKITKMGGKSVNETGRYHGESPLQAAKKAFGQYCRHSGKRVCKSTSFTLQETTQNSKQKSFHYVGKRVKLRDPVERSPRGADPYTIKHENVVRKA